MTETEPSLEPGVHQDEVRIHTRIVTWVAVIAIVIAVIAVVIAGLLLTAQPRPILMPGPVVDGINTRQIAIQARGLKQETEARRRLDGWGWVDRQRGIAHIPIEEAMELWLERQGNLQTSPGESPPEESP